MIPKSRLIIFICFLLLFVDLVTPAESFIQTAHFDKASYKPGEVGVFSVTIEGEVGVDQSLYFTRLEIFFDWGGNYWESVITQVDPGETKTITVTFPVPGSVSPGNHSCYYELTWSLSISLENPVTSIGSSNIITIAEPTPQGTAIPWEFMTIIGIVVGVVIGVAITFLVMKTKSKAIS